jgi:hypothetical protein
MKTEPLEGAAIQSKTRVLPKPIEAYTIPKPKRFNRKAKKEKKSQNQDRTLNASLTEFAKGIWDKQSVMNLKEEEWQNLLNHDRPFHCPEPSCNLAFKTKGVLNNHYVQHMDEKVRPSINIHSPILVSDVPRHLRG